MVGWAWIEGLLWYSVEVPFTKCCMDQVENGWARRGPGGWTGLCVGCVVRVG